jgi:activator of HSP90 ATPase
MNSKIPAAATPHTLSRRRALAGIAVALVGAAAGSRARADGPEAAKGATASPENLKRTAIHQEVDIRASPQRIYDVLMDQKQFASMTGRTAEIDPKEGGAFSLFGGLIVGRNIELVPGVRVVQAWRPGHWDPGVYSMARFELKAKGSFATIVFAHTGFPEGEYDSLLSGWNGHYWGPLAKYLS